LRSFALTDAGVCLLDKLRPAILRHRFPAEVINHALWLYHLFAFSLRDIELILADRGVVVTHESIRHWCRNSVLSLPDGAARNADHSS
jgi:transposase-like protein